MRTSERCTSGTVKARRESRLRSEGLSGVVGSAAGQEFGQAAHSIAHQTTDFEEGEVIATGRAPDGESADLHAQDLGCLLVVYMDGRGFGVVAKLRGNFGLDCLDLIGGRALHGETLYGIKLGRTTWCPAGFDRSGIVSGKRIWMSLHRRRLVS